MRKYIDAEKLKEDIQANLAAISFNDDYQEGYEACGMSVLKSIESLQQEQPKVDLEKVWDWIDETFTEREIDSRYGESRNVVMSGFDVCKSDLREKYERDFGLNARKEE